MLGRDQGTAAVDLGQSDGGGDDGGGEAVNLAVQLDDGADAPPCDPSPGGGVASQLPPEGFKGAGEVEPGGHFAGGIRSGSVRGRHRAG